ncbi:hypothetical protein HispidOSU_008525 [Sigmodon hispidus]
MGKLFKENEPEQQMDSEQQKCAVTAFRWRNEQSMHQVKVLAGSGYAARIPQEFEDSPSSPFTLLGENAAKFSGFEVDQEFNSYSGGQNLGESILRLKCAGLFIVFCFMSKLIFKRNY